MTDIDYMRYVATLKHKTMPLPANGLVTWLRENKQHHTIENYIVRVKSAYSHSDFCRDKHYGQIRKWFGEQVLGHTFDDPNYVSDFCGYVFCRMGVTITGFGSIVVSLYDTDAPNEGYVVVKFGVTCGEVFLASQYDATDKEEESRLYGLYDELLPPFLRILEDFDLNYDE